MFFIRRILAIIFFCIPYSLTFAQSDRTESLTITTYYPAPYGVYKNLRLYPSAQLPPGSPGAQRGTMYYNATDDQIYYFDGDVWKAFVSFDQMPIKTVRGDNPVCPPDTTEFARKWVPRTCGNEQICAVCFSAYQCKNQCTTRKSWVYNNTQGTIVPHCDYGCMLPEKDADKKGGSSTCEANRWEAIMCLGN